MRQNHTGFFHKAIITSLCCIILTGCGYKTSPVYVDESKTEQAQDAASQK